MKKCFFVTPIGSDSSPERKISDDVLEFLIQPICKDLNFEVIRVDKLNTVDKINETVLQELRESDLVIVDMTSHNPNVFYEFGYRHALSKPLIPIIKENTDDIPFDVVNLRTIFYSLEARPLSQAKDKLRDTINSFTFEDAPDEVLTTSDSTLPISLLKINDKLDEILLAIDQRNIEDIALVSEQVAKFAKPKEDLETAMMKELFPKMLENPKLLENMMNLSERFPGSN